MGSDQHEDRDREDRVDTVDASAEGALDEPAHEALVEVETDTGFNHPQDIQSLVETLDTGAAQPSVPRETCLVEIAGESPGRVIVLDRPRYTLGRLDESDIVLGSGVVSREHARIGLTDYGYILADLDSTNGTFVNEIRITECPLRRGDFVKIGGTIFKFIAATDLDTAIAAERRRIESIDALTQLMTRAAFVETLGHRLAAAEIAGNEISVVAMEVESFDALERRHTPAALDRVLSLLAGLIRQRVRSADVLAHIDRSRFALLLDCCDPSAAGVLADKLRRFVALSAFRHGEEPIPVSIATGAATVGPGASPSAESLLDLALADLPISQAPE